MSKKSIYGGPANAGNSKFFNPDGCKTVGDLKKELAKVPDALPLNPDCSLPIWFNLGLADEHLSFDDPETWK